MKFITIDTAGSTMQVALYNNGVVTTACEDSFRRTSEKLMPSVDKLLTESKLLIKDLDFVGVSVGPGSFTGIRIGVTTARAMAQFSGKKIVSVTELNALSYNNDKGGMTASLMDASNGFVYACVYDAEFNPLIKEQVIKENEIESFLKTNKHDIICGDYYISNLLGNKYKNLATTKPNCFALVEACKNAYSSKGGETYEKICPLYIRLSQAEQDVRDGKL